MALISGNDFSVVTAGSPEAIELCDEIFGRAANILANGDFMALGHDRSREDVVLFDGGCRPEAIQFSASIEFNDGGRPYAAYLLNITRQNMWEEGDYWPSVEDDSGQTLSIDADSIDKLLDVVAEADVDDECDEEDEVPNLRHVQEIITYGINGLTYEPTVNIGFAYFNNLHQLIDVNVMGEPSLVSDDRLLGVAESQDMLSFMRFTETQIEEIFDVLRRLGLLALND